MSKRIHQSSSTAIIPAGQTRKPLNKRQVQSLSRLSGVMEPLESRTLMSASGLPAPTAVKTTAVAPTSITVNWSEASAANTGYNVLRSTAGSDYSQVAHITSRNTLSYTDKTVSSDVSYSYRVQAVGAANSVSATSGSASVTTPLISPAHVTATVAAGPSVALAWTDADTNATGYSVLRATDGVHFSALATIHDKGTTTYTDSSVATSASYKYEVQAINSTNSSAVVPSAAVTTPLTAPSGLAASISSGTVSLTWTDNDTHATGYIVLRSIDGTHFSTQSKLTGASTASFSDKSISPSTTYYYEVQATSALTTSPASGSTSVTTPLAVPSVVKPTIGATSVTLTWTDTDAGAQGFDVLRSDGGSFTQVGQVTAKSFTDTTVRSNKTYSYEIKAYHNSTTSDASTAITLLTPLLAPSGVAASAINTTSVAITWTDNDTAATGYAVGRSTDGKHFSTLTTLTSASAASYTDSTVVSGHAYTYEIVAINSTNVSPPTAAVTATTPLAAPTGLAATALTATSIQLNWTNTDASATGVKIFRSTDGSTFTLLATGNSGSASTFTDNQVSSMTTYYYKVEAIDAATTSAMSAAAQATTPLAAPGSLTATLNGAWINLSWINKDSHATGYTILRSTDGVNFSTLGTLSSTGASAYADMTVTAGTKYYYQVEATTSSITSAVSNTASATATAATSTTAVTIATRYGDELVITETGADDSVAVSQTGSTLTIVADGQTSTQTAPAAGLFIYSRGGTDGISIAQSVTTRTTIQSVDGKTTDIASAGTNVTAWIDSTDVFSGTGTVHAITSYAGNVAKTTGASLADPKDAGATMKVNSSLFGTGPVAGDVNQSGIGDCYFLSSLAAFAGTKPTVLLQSAVDNGDGTYTVQFYNSANSPVFVRVNNDISTGPYWGYENARPGTSGNIWAMIMEKAYAYFRTGANTYASLNSGWMGDVYSALGQSNNFFICSNYTESSFYSMISTDLANSKAVTFGTTTAPNLVSGHAYTLVSASIDSNGVTHYVVRNPWGVSGDSLENSAGYATLTFAQMQANFYDGCQAT